MSDFSQLLERVVAKLSGQSPEIRRSIYERARVALIGHIRRDRSPDAECALASKDIALDAVIVRVEAQLQAEESRSDTLNRLEPDSLIVPAWTHSGGDEALAAISPALGSPPVDERRRLAYNAVVGGVANLVKVAIQLVLLPVMARLLGPAEFGLYALALPTISFFTVLADGGLGTSLAREEEAATSVWSTAFWALLASCSAIACTTIVGGMILAAVSGQPRLAGIMALLSISFPLLAISALPAARLVRRGNLMVHSIGDLVSTVLGAGVAVLLAVYGAGASSLAVQYVLGFAIRAALLNYAAFEWPTFEFRFAALWPHAATGGSVIGSRLSEFAGRLVENVVFGRMFGPAALGTYTFANQASRFLCEAAGNPLWGALYSHALREDARQIEPLHTKLSRLLALALFPASALLAASAPQIFDVVLGHKWADSAVLVQILVPFYALNAVAAQCGAIMLANGRNATMFWTLTGLSGGRLLAVALCGWAGPIWIAWGMGAANMAYAAAMFATVGKTTGASAWPLIRELLPSVVASAAAGIVCYALIGWRPESLVWTILSVGLGGSAFVAGVALLQGRKLVTDALAIRRIIFSRRR